MISVMEEEKSKGVIKSYLLATFTFIIWGTSFTMGKFITPEPFSPINITFFRTLIGTLTIGMILGIKGLIPQWFVVFKKNFLKYFLVGVTLYAFAFIFEYWALSRTQASNQAMLSNSMTFWVVLINTFIFKQKPSKKFLVGLFFAVIGVVLILLSDDLNFSSSTIIGDVGTLGAYFIWGMYSAFTAKLNENVNPLFTTFSIFLTSLVILLPLSLIQGGFQEFSQLEGVDWIALLYLGIFCGGIAFYTYNLALSNKNISSEYITIFSLLNPILGVITGVLLLHEVIAPRQIIGIIIILSAMMITNNKPKLREVEQPFEVKLDEIKK